MLWWCCPVEHLSRCSSVRKSGQTLMPCGSLFSMASVFQKEQCPGWAVTFLITGVHSAVSPSQHWFGTHNAALWNQWERSPSKLQLTTASSHLHRGQQKSATNELGFHRQDLTTGIVCNSPHHIVTPHGILDTEALAKTAISDQGFVYHQRWVCFCHYRIPSVYVSCLCLCHSEQSPFLVNL